MLTAIPECHPVTALQKKTHDQEGDAASRFLVHNSLLLAPAWRSLCFFLFWLLVSVSGITALLCVFVSLNRFMEDLHHGHFINCESARPTGA
jgi:hypothetical protein